MSVFPRPARRAADVLFRRLPLGHDPEAVRRAAPRVIDRMARRLGWNEDRRRRESDGIERELARAGRPPPEPSHREDTMGARPFLVGGAPRKSAEVFEVLSPYDGARVAAVCRAGPRDIEDALEAARRGFETMRRLPGWKRAGILFESARLLGESRDALARTIALEAGKPIAQARGEVDRAALTVRTAAQEATRIDGEVLPLDVARGNDSRFGIVELQRCLADFLISRGLFGNAQLLDIPAHGEPSKSNIISSVSTR